MKDYAQEISQKFIDQLAQGTVPWRKPWSPVLGSPLANFYTKRPYRGINTLLLGLQQQAHGYTSPYWTTFKKAAANGNYVRKGEKGTTIVLWKPLEVVDKATGEKKKIPLLRAYTVFNTDQIDGITVDLPAPREVISVPDALKSIYDGYKDAPALEHRGQDKAYYSPGEDRVVLPTVAQFHTVEGYAETFCHELTHSTGCEKRLGRYTATDFTVREEYAKEELVAEIGSSMLMQHVGITPNIPSMANYVKGWMSAISNDSNLIIRAAQAAQKSCDHILGVAPYKSEEE